MDKIHPLSIKSLIDIRFQKEDGNKDENVCPACLKTLSNASKLSGNHQTFIIQIVECHKLINQSNSVTKLRPCSLQSLH